MDDLISRQAAIDDIKRDRDASVMPWVWYDGVNFAINHLINMSSAQSEKRTEERTETQSCDLIDRQAAIDAMEESKRIYVDRRVIIGKMQDIVSNLPSAQPETAHKVKGKVKAGVTLWYSCDHCERPVDKYDAYCHCCGRRFVDE